MMKRLADVIDAPASLLPAAVSVCMHGAPETTIASTAARISEMSRTVAQRVHGSQTQALVAHLHEYLFEELAMVGNSDDYHNPDNSSIHMVVETRRGLPIVLGLIYKLVGDGIGLNTWGVGLPGHFLAGVEINGAACLVDAFNSGRILTPEEAQARVTAHFGAEVEWSDRLLAPVTNRYWVTRILQNLLTAYGKTENFNELGAVLEMELLLWPEESRLQRDLAVVLARGGKQDIATRYLEEYLLRNPDDPEKANLRQMIWNK